MAIYKYNEIKMLHLELTSKCNAGCPMCARNIQGGKINPLLPLTELSLEDIQRIFTPAFIQQLHKVFVCGNYGDPIMAKEALPILKYFREISPSLNLGIHTNGGVRDESFWQNLAKTLTYCRFGIDGLSDTNHLYRQNIKWSLLERNVRSFIDAGGHAEWDFLVFKHNEHQVEQARRLSLEWGFKKFNVKSTSRFFSSHRQKVREKVPVHTADGSYSHDLERSTLSEFQNAFYDQQEKILHAYGDLPSYWNQVSIDCKVAKEKSVYVSAQGWIFPCCWIGNEIYSKHIHSDENQVLKILQTLPGGSDAIDALKRPLKEILEDSNFFSEIAQSWKLPEIKEGRLKTCARTCGVELRPFENQFIDHA